jgi:tetratricopeptide (TPR) repeat protein
VNHTWLKRCASGKLKTSTLAEPAFVGRTNELSELMRFLDSMIKGEGSTVFISGEAGSGKSRLSKEFLDTARNKGITVLSGWCLSNIAVPYFPFIEVFDSSTNTEIRDSFFDIQQITMRTKLAGSSSETISEEDKFFNPQVWKDKAFSAITKKLLNLSSKNPTILFIDDIHWADSASLALLHYIARAASSERLLVLATYRSEESKTKSQGQPNPLIDVLRLMKREEIVQEIELSGLNLSEITKIAEYMLGGLTDSEFIKVLSEESNGNPLFIIEMLRMIYSQGTLIQENGQWHLVKRKISVPDKVREIILRRIETLKSKERKILNIASVIGEKFSPEIISAVISKDKLTVLETLNCIWQRTFLVLPEGNNYKFKHDKIREMLYNEIPSALRIEYHLRIADFLESNRPLNSLPLNDLAYHYTEGQNREKSLKYSLAAGQDALKRYSNNEAISHFKFVLTNDFTTEIEKRVALEGLGDAYYANCMFEQAIKTFRELAKIEVSVSKLRALRKEMEAIWYKEMDSQRLMDLVKETEPYASSDRLESARVRWNKGRALLWLGNVKASLKDHEEALRVFEEVGSLIDVAWALWGTGITRVILGLNEEKGLGEIMRGIAMHHELGDAHGEVLALRNGGVDTFSFCCLSQESYVNALNLVRVGQQIGDFNSVAGALVALSDISEKSGDIAQALNYALRAQEFANRTDSEITQCKINARLVGVFSLQQDISQAEKYYDKLMKLPQEIRFHPNNILYVISSLAVFYAVKKQWSEVEREIEQCSKAFPNSMAAKFLVLYLQAFVFKLQGKAEQANKLAEETYRLNESVQKKFDRVNIQANLMMTREVPEGQEFELRFDFVNVGKKNGSITRIDNVIPSSFEVIEMPSFCRLNKDCLEIENMAVDAFQVKTIKLTAKPSNIGEFYFSPKPFFTDNIGKSKCKKLKRIKIKVRQTQSIITTAEDTFFIFKSQAAQKASNFLIKALFEDLHKQKLSQEKAGWRTLVDLIKKGKLTNYSVYGTIKHRGIALQELERLGLIETQYFIGERGRGGRIMKIRIAYEKEKIKNYANTQIVIHQNNQ